MRSVELFQQDGCRFPLHEPTVYLFEGGVATLKGRFGLLAEIIPKVLSNPSRQWPYGIATQETHWSTP